MQLSAQQRKYLKSLAHQRKPVVTIGNNGLTDPVFTELEQSLAHHELIKIKLPAGEKKMKIDMLEAICKKTKASLVNLIGRTGVVFRQSKESKFTLP